MAKFLFYIFTLWQLWPCCARFAPAQNADVAQLVARNLAKVQVAGSNPVVRSDIRPPAFHRGPYFHGGMAERRGKGLQIPLHGFKSRSDLQFKFKKSKE